MRAEASGRAGITGGASGAHLTCGAGGTDGAGLPLLTLRSCGPGGTGGSRRPGATGDALRTLLAACTCRSRCSDGTGESRCPAHATRATVAVVTAWSPRTGGARCTR